MKLRLKPYEQITSGKKKYELRLYDEKRKNIRVGDEIIFTEMESGRRCEVKVVGLLTFASFDELYKSLPKEELGYDENSAKSASPHDMEKYYSKEEQSDYGVVAIKIALIQKEI